MSKRGQKGQLTIFIIIAILIVAIVLFILLFWPKIKGFGSETKNPYVYMETCIGNDIKDTIETVTSQGGVYEVDEGISFFYQGEYIRFLCHTNSYFELCYRQVAFLKESIENEIQTNIEDTVSQCFRKMRESYEKKGYTVNVQEVGDFEVNILPDGISINLGRDLILTKGDSVEEYRNFAVKEESKLYEIIEVVDNILLWEQTVGESAPEAYIFNYPYIDIEKRLKDNNEYDDVKLYTVTHTETEEEFKFASRSLAFPTVVEVPVEE